MFGKLNHPKINEELPEDLKKSIQLFEEFEGDSTKPEYLANVKIPSYYTSMVSFFNKPTPDNKDNTETTGSKLKARATKKSSKPARTSTRKVTPEPNKNYEHLWNITKAIKEQLEVHFNETPISAISISKFSAVVARLRHGSNIFQHRYYVQFLSAMTKGNAEDQIINLEIYQAWNITEEGIKFLNILRSAVWGAEPITTETSKTSQGIKVLLLILPIEQCTPQFFRDP
ncbi:hypothetical protein U1Q18_047399 [Sarracenia purpurea var. burkii]